MIEGGNSKSNEVKSADNTESRLSAPEKLYQELAKVANKLNEMFFDDDRQNENKGTDSRNETKHNPDVHEKNDVKDISETSRKDVAGSLSSNIAELVNKLFSDDIFKDTSESGNKLEEKNESKDSGETDVEKKDPIIEKIQQSIGTPEGIKALIEKHPEKAELWERQLEALDILNNPDASPAEIRSAQAKLSILKGQLLETAVKDALSEAGLDVEVQQRVVKGETGGTRPDVIAKNNTDHPIEVFGITIQPGETLSAECKCGCSAYMTDQLNNHIPNQLSGQEGTKVLLTTSDIKDTPAGLADSVCEKYGAKLVTADVSVADVENAIKEVSES